MASRRARIAITSSFILTFLVMLTFVLTIGQLNDLIGEQADAAGLIKDFRWIIATIIVSYFSTEAGISQGPGKVVAARLTWC